MLQDTIFLHAEWCNIRLKYNSTKMKILKNGKKHKTLFQMIYYTVLYNMSSNCKVIYQNNNKKLDTN